MILLKEMRCAQLRSEIRTGRVKKTPSNQKKSLKFGFENQWSDGRF
jgi:hypothetical protein